MRAQLSLLFTDKNLFENFIVPCKNDRRLHSIIMKCLSAYYYNVEVRNMIEGSELHTDNEVDEKINSHQDSINNIRDLLAMQGFISKELENTMEDGIDDMSDMLDHVNKTAEDFSVVKTTETEYGGKSMKLLSLADKGQPEKSVKVEQASSTLEGVTPDIVKMVTQMYSMFSQQESFKQMFGNDMVDISKQVNVVKEDIAVESGVTNQGTTDIGDLSVDDFEVAPPPIINQESMDETPLGEAADALGDLMSSLYG